MFAILNLHVNPRNLQILIWGRWNIDFFYFRCIRIKIFIFINENTHFICTVTLFSPTKALWGRCINRNKSGMNEILKCNCSIRKKYDVLNSHVTFHWKMFKRAIFNGKTKMASIIKRLFPLRFLFLFCI